QDEKELAEHNMLVDLGRNDCGKVCEFGSIEVKDYMKINRFSKVMHIASSVEGTLKKACTSMDALSAIIPAGTLSGAPKIMACNIIDEYEPSRRGLYGGAIGYINFSLDMDMCITIRTAVKSHDTVHVQAGGGIVMDSHPESEYQESIDKASAIISAINMANEVEAIK
ncbi:MAG: anthranilate synthase component I family protein, partial [Bacillota bacterium]